MTLEPKSEDLHKICGGIFKISRIFGLFPFKVLQNRLALFIPSMLPLILAELGTVQFWIDIAFSLRSPYLTAKLTMSTVIMVYVPICILPIVSDVWLTRNVRKLNKLLNALLRIESITHHGLRQSLRFESIVTVLGYICLVVDRSYLNGFGNMFKGWGCELINFANFFVFLQIIYLVKSVRGHLTFLVDSVDSRNAEEFCKAHEVLTSCCSIIAECYSPQILLICLEYYVSVISASYLLTLDLKYGFYNQMVAHVLWLLMAFFNPFCLLYHCHEAVMKAKQFDKILYRLVINDDSRALVRNKRIRIHFKGKRKVEFSAMGFFNLDYPLICSMVCSATTYIVILVQFSN